MFKARWTALNHDTKKVGVSFTVTEFKLIQVEAFQSRPGGENHSGSKLIDKIIKFIVINTIAIRMENIQNAQSYSDALSIDHLVMRAV